MLPAAVLPTLSASPRAQCIVGSVLVEACVLLGVLPMLASSWSVGTASPPPSVVCATAFKCEEAVAAAAVAVVVVVAVAATMITTIGTMTVEAVVAVVDGDINTIN